MPVDITREAVVGIIKRHGRQDPITAAEICKAVALLDMTIDPRTIAKIAASTRHDPDDMMPIFGFKSGNRGYCVPHSVEDYDVYLAHLWDTIVDELDELWTTKTKRNRLAALPLQQADLFIGSKETGGVISAAGGEG